MAGDFGNEAMVRLEALPKELGYAVILKPLVSSRKTNLILETSTGTTERLIDVNPNNIQYLLGMKVCYIIG
jgi:hypothetical protein